MAVVALAMGRSKRGLGRPRAFSFRAPSKLNQREEKAEEETGRLERLAGRCADEAPGQELAGREPARRLARQLRL